MQASKIYIEPLKKTFEVRHTNRLVKLSYAFQLTMSKMGAIADVEDPDKQFETAQNYASSLVDFPKEALKLTDQQAEILDDTEQDELQKIDVKLALTIQGLPKKAIAETLADMDNAVDKEKDAQKSKK